MLRMTEKFKKHIGPGFSKEEGYMRVYLAPSAGGKKLAIALDILMLDNDKILNIDGHIFIINEDLFEIAKPMVVDMTQSGIEISSPKSFAKE